MELHISVAGKIATYQKRDGDIVCGNNDYSVRFTFDAEWDSVADKTARFIWNGVYQDQPITNGVCAVPTIRGAREVQIGVYGGDLHTTTPAVIICRPSILCQDPDANPDTGRDYEAALTKLVRDAEEAADRTEAAAADMTGLPDVTTADNDKILQVVGGVWVAIPIADSTIPDHIDQIINEALEGDY